MIPGTYIPGIMYQYMIPGTYIPGIMYQYMIPGTYIPGTYQVRKEESYRLSSTCGAPRNHTNVPPVDAHV